LSSSPHFSPSAGEGSGIRRPSTAVLIVLSGARAGTRRELTADFATLGRHPSSELQLDPEQDTEVSPRHAAVFRQGPGFVVRDLGSATGTWVNGVRVRSDRSLENGIGSGLAPRDRRSRFTVEQTHERPPARLVMPMSRRQPIRPSPIGRTAVIEQEQSMTELKLRVEAARQTDKLRRRLFVAAVVGVLAVFAAIAWLAWSARQSRLALEREQNRLFAKVDSVHALLGGGRRAIAGLRSALEARGARRAAAREDHSEGTSRRRSRPSSRQVLSGTRYSRSPVARRTLRSDAYRHDEQSRDRDGLRRVHEWRRSRANRVRAAGERGHGVGGHVARNPRETVPRTRPNGSRWDSTAGPRRGARGSSRRTPPPDSHCSRVSAWGHVFPVAEVRDSGSSTAESVVVFGFAVADLGEPGSGTDCARPSSRAPLVGSAGTGS
jgi:pSer/pThr/pTyr-binding forkhead associated (FHA) protein